MGRSKDLTININADNSGFKKRLNEASLETEKLNRNFKRLSKVSAIAFTGLTAAIGGTVLAFRGFERDFTQVVTLLDKASFGAKSLESGIDDLKKGVLNLRASSGESFQTLNKGLFDLVSAGIPAAKAINTLTIATELAAAGGTDVSIAVDALTKSINAFGLEASDAEQVAQKFFLAQKNGQTTVEELANSIGVAASSANSFGVSLDELLAATAATTKAGKTASQSLTGLNQIFVNIAKPTKEAADEAERLGIEFNSSALRAKGLERFLKDLTQAEGFTTSSIEKLFGSVEAMGVAFALTGEQNADFISTLKQLQDEAKLTDTFNEALAASNATVDKTINELIGSFQSVLAVIGEQFAPLIISVSKKLSNFAKFILNADKGTLSIVKSVGIFSLALTGLATVLGIVGSALIVVRTGIKATGLQMLFTAKAARVFWLAVSGPIGKVVAGLAFVATGVVSIAKAFADDDSAEKVKETKQSVEDLRSEQQQLIDQITANDKKASEQAAKELARIDTEIAKLEELKEFKEEMALEEQEAKDLIREIELEQQVQFNETEKQLLQDQITGKKQITNKFLLDSLKTQDKGNQRFLLMQKKFGTTFAKVDKAFNNEKVKGIEQTANRLAALKNSENKTLAAIGKAAAIISIGIDTAKGAIAAYASLAGIPLIGPALGAAAAAALVAFGLEQASKVKTSGAVRGGFVSQGTAGVDNQPFLLSRGESIIPADITPELFNTFRELRNIRDNGGLLNTIAQAAILQPDIQTTTVVDTQRNVETVTNIIDNAQDEAEPQNIRIEVEILEEAADIITAQQRENEELNIGVI